MLAGAPHDESLRRSCSAEMYLPLSFEQQHLWVSHIPEAPKTEVFVFLHDSKLTCC